MTWIMRRRSGVLQLSDNYKEMIVMVMVMVMVMNNWG